MTLCIFIGYYLELCLEYQKVTEKAKDYEFEKMWCHQEKALP